MLIWLVGWPLLLAHSLYFLVGWFGLVGVFLPLHIHLGVCVPWCQAILHSSFPSSSSSNPKEEEEEEEEIQITTTTTSTF